MNYAAGSAAVTVQNWFLEVVLDFISGYPEMIYFFDKVFQPFLEVVQFFDNRFAFPKTFDCCMVGQRLEVYNFITCFGGMCQLKIFNHSYAFAAIAATSSIF